MVDQAARYPVRTAAPRPSNSATAGATAIPGVTLGVPDDAAAAVGSGLSAGGFVIGSEEHLADLRRVRTLRGTQSGMAGQTAASAAENDAAADAAADRAAADRAANDAQDRAEFVNSLMGLYPWMAQIGLDARWFQDAAARSGSNAGALLAEIRSTDQYRARFPSITRSDGSIRMNEAQYFSTEADYRNLLKQYGYDVDLYDTPVSLTGLFESDMDPNELQTRLQTYSDIKSSSQGKKDAFYVYAGLDLSDDDLYLAAVDPAAAQNLSNAYNESVAAGKFDYATFIARATEVANTRVADVLTQMQRYGKVTGAAVQAVLRVDPAFAQQIMDAIYTGGEGGTSQQSLSLEELVQSFEYALVGAAATGAGLTLPTRERIGEIRQAGVQNAQAAEAYLAYGMQRGVFTGAVERAGFDEFTQDDFERAQFLGDAGLSNELQTGLAREEAAGKGSGEFRFSEEKGRLTQRGFGVR